jgi:hypothetical protein
MATRSREKFETHVNPEILSAVKAIAQSEGRELRALVDEALADLIEKRKKGRPRAHVMTAHETSPGRSRRFTKNWLNDGLRYRRGGARDSR